MQVNDGVISVYRSSSNVSYSQTVASQSNDFAGLLQSYQSSRTSAESIEQDVAALEMETNQGTLRFNLDDFFSPQSSSEAVNIVDIPVLVPTAHNVEVLSEYVEKKFKDLIDEYGIDSPPSSIEFDQSGNLVLPDNYPYSAQLQQALSENPSVEKALRTTTALASHYVGIMASQPFRDEMATARTQTDRDRIVEKYSYLFNDNRATKQIVLSFLDDGSLLLAEKNT